MLNVKQNDLAILIHATHEENIGNIGQVLSFIGPFHYGDDPLPTPNCWLVEFLRPVLVDVVDLFSEERRQQYMTTLTVPDAWLRPIRGEEGPEPVKQKIEPVPDEMIA